MELTPVQMLEELAKLGEVSTGCMRNRIGRAVSYNVIVTGSPSFYGWGNTLDQAIKDCYDRMPIKEELMDAQTAKALEGSIAKWAKIVAELAAGAVAVQENGAFDCQLCGLYHPSNRPGGLDVPSQEACYPCPVALKVSDSLCHGTPYREWLSTHTKENAQAMLDFLIALRSE